MSASESVAAWWIGAAAITLPVVLAVTVLTAVLRPAPKPRRHRRSR